MGWSSFRGKKKKDSPPLPAGYRGWPETVVIEDPSDPQKVGVSVRDACLTPGAARVADILVTLGGLAAGLDMAVLSLEVGTLEFFIGAAAGVGGFVLVLRWFLLWLFARSFWIRIFADRVEVADWRRFYVYEEEIGYTFRLEEHEKALDEDLQVRQRPEAGRYYSNCLRLFLEHGRQGVDLGEFYPKERAKALQGRLIAIQEGFRVGSIG